MKPGIAILVVVVVAAIVVIMSLNSAHASHCHNDTTTNPTPERLIYQPDGSAEYCRTYSNGVTYCR